MKTINGLDQWILQMIRQKEDESPRDFGPFFEAISERVAYFLDHDPDLLMSYLYRLDVSEKQLKKALEKTGEGDIVENIARLIFDRQMERVRTKEQYGHKPIDETGWEW